MKIIAISDTHNFHHRLELPPGDVLIHAGDATTGGSAAEWNQFREWFAAQPHPAKLYVPGNHDLWVYKNQRLAERELGDFEAKLLVDNGAILDGKVFWGSPWSRPFGHTAAYMIEAEQRKTRFDQIPETVDVLITHAPRYGVMDVVDGETEHLGDEMLDLVLNEEGYGNYIHIFGHIHSGHGVKVGFNGEILWVNAAVCDEDYDPVNPPVVLHI